MRVRIRSSRTAAERSLRLAEPQVIRSISPMAANLAAGLAMD
jgi:hypothetical protein